MTDCCLGIKKFEETKAYSFWTKCQQQMFEMDPRKRTGPHWIVVISIPEVWARPHRSCDLDRYCQSASILLLLTAMAVRIDIP